MTAENPGPLLDLEERLRFETLVADLSSRFVNLRAGEVDREIKEAQRRVCECLGIDLCGLWQWSVGFRGSLALTHLYRSGGSPPTPDPMDAEEYFPWCLQELLAGRVIAISSMGEMPPEAARDREVYSQFGIKSTLVIPLSTGGGPLIGALGFNDTKEERLWSEALVKRLQLISQVFANAIVRKHTEQALRESENRLTMALEAAGAGAWSMDVQSRRVWVSTIEAQLFGFSPGEQLTYDSFLHRVHPDDRESVRMAVEKALRTKAKLFADYRIVGPDGGVRWVAARGYPHFNEKAEPDRLMGIALDITERKRTEAALEETRALVTAVINSTDDFVWSVDAERFGLLTWNRALRDYFFERMHIDIRVGMPPEELLPPDYAAVWRDFYSRALREGFLVTEYEVAAHTNTLLLSIHPMQRDGKVFGISVFGKDITERKRAEDAVRVLAGKLLTAQEAERSRIAREMHDDLTQRIAVLAIQAGKLEQASDGSASLSDKLREMKDQLIRLSQDVHALSRQLHPSILDDLGLVDALRSECTSFSQREGISIRYTPQEVPAGIPKEVALCLYRIAQEALRNIVKHSRAQEAWVALTKTDDGLLLSIEDTGVGFSSDQTRGKLGLGLDSMEERARLIGGELTIRSEPGKGTFVDVWVPCSGETP